MATSEQVNFLYEQVRVLREQTLWAQETATHAEHQITATRYLRALAATEMLIGLVEVDGNKDTLFDSPFMSAIGETLGFDKPENEEDTSP